MLPTTLTYTNNYLNTTTTITSYPTCNNPIVTISGLSPNTSNVLNAVQIYRSAVIALSLKFHLNCEITQQTTIAWTVFKYDNDPEVSLKKSVYRSVLSSLDLLIAERDLPYGFYQVNVRAEMKGLPDVFGEDLLEIQVIQTPWIKASVASGSFHTVPFGNLGTLNASASFDPDFDGIDGMLFAWYCRDVDEDPFLLSNLTDEALLTIPEANASATPLLVESRGCFGTGRGRLNETNSFLELDTNSMAGNKTYSIALVVSKGHPEFGLRQAMFNIFFFIARGSPPELRASCSKNCLAKINRNEKIILVSTCTSFCYGKLELSWSLYYYDNIDMQEPFHLTNLNEIPKDEFQQMASNPINELDLAIKPNTLKSGTKYVLELRATRPNGIYGKLRYTMVTNSNPENGDCSVSPLFGVAMNTSFTLSCENWIDTDSPLTYEFSYESKGSRTMLFYRTVVSGLSISFTDWLPVGDKVNEYKLNVVTNIKDSFGAKTERKFVVKVAADNNVDVNQLTSLVSGDGNMLDQYLKDGNVQGAVSLSSTLVSLLDNINQDATTSNKEVSKQIKRQILISLSQVAPTDESSMLQMSGIVNVLTSNADELLPEAKDAALQMCESIVDILKVLSDGNSGFQNIKKGASNLVGVIGGVASSFSKGNESGQTAENMEQHVKASVKRSIELVQNVQLVVLDNLITNEGAETINGDTLSLQVEKISASSFGQKENSVRNSRFKPPPASAFGLGEILNDPNNTLLQMQPIDIKMAVFNSNPFIWDNTSDTVTSNVVDIVLESKLNISSSNVSSEIALTVARDSSKFPRPTISFLKPSETNKTMKTKEYLKYHCYSRSSNYTSVNFEMDSETHGLHYKVYLKKGGKPDIKNGAFDFLFELPDLSSCTVNNETVSHSHVHNSEHIEDQPIFVDPNNCLRHPYTIFVPNTELNGTGQYCFAIQHVEHFRNFSEDDLLNTAFSSRNKRSIACEVGKRRVRRSCVIIPPAPPKPTPYRPTQILSADNLGFDGNFFFPNQTPNYNLTIFESSCVYWDVVNETFKGDGCRVAPGTNKDQVLCLCTHLTSFGSDLLVAPNPIDFDSVFANFGSLSENVAVLALISTIIGLYILGVFWARRADKHDELMIGPTILNTQEGCYKYIITVHTGKRHQAGTTARVVLKLCGDQGDTLPIRLRDHDRPCFQRGQDNVFVASCPQGVGNLTHIQIWHDISGYSPCWYLSRLTVQDLQSGEHWQFVCENWLAVEYGDGKVCRVLYVAGDKELTNFNHLFAARTEKGLVDSHLWFSIVSRPPTSNFTRVQRLTCALCLICCTMITSAMFYNMGGTGPSPFSIQIGSLLIDLKPFIIGLQSSIIIVPVNVAVVQIFRNLRPKVRKKDKYAESVESLKDEDTQTVSVAEIEATEQKAPKGKLPHWFTYIAYALCYLASAASIFFTLLYSIQWGKETSTEWVIAMVTSFFQSVLLLQPIKVVVAAVVFALLIRKPDPEEKSNDKLLFESTEEAKIDGERAQKFKSRNHSYYSPPTPERIEQARAKRLKEIKMNEAVKEIIAFFCFLLLLMSVVLHHRDPKMYLLTKTLSETFDEVDAYGIDFAAVSDQDSLWMYTRETLIPGLYAGDWYNGAKSTKGYIANMEDYLVGVPRLRLLRVEEDSCAVASNFEDTIPHCYSGYSVANEETSSFEVSWGKKISSASRKRRDVLKSTETEKEWLALMDNAPYLHNSQEDFRKKRALDPITSGRNRRKKKRLLASAKPKPYPILDNAILPDGKILSCLERWRHQTMIDLRGFPYWGTVAMYSGSGYVANLGYDPVKAYSIISDLHSNGWIDIQTRAVFSEFTVYNANANLFGIVSLFVEFPPSSSVVTKVHIQTTQFYLHLTSAQMLAHILVIFFMMYFFYREGKLVYKQRCAYFKGFWNWVETILVFSEFATIILFLARLYEVDRNLLQLRENPNDYVGFQYAGTADALFAYVLGILVFFYNIRMIRLLRFNKTFLLLGKTLERITWPILNFCLPFFFGFFAFGLFAFTIFGSELEDYSSFYMTLITQFSMTLGDFDFEALVSVSPLFGSLYFFAFIGMNVMILMNMFLAIVNDSFADIQEENADLENEYEILDYLKENLLQSVDGVFHRGKVSPEKKKKKKKRRSNNKEVGELLSTSTKECTDQLDKRAEALDNIMDEVDKSLYLEEVIDKKFCLVPKERRLNLSFQVLCLMGSLDNKPDGVKVS